MDDAWVPEDVSRDAIIILRPFRKIFATEAEMTKERLLRDRLIADERDEQLQEIEIPMNDEIPEPRSRSRKKKPVRRKSSDALEEERRAGNPRRRPSFEAFVHLKNAMGRTLSGEGSRKTEES
eukprot:CAMPEP_0117028164 /NCGR_PEP_ID=MMETSP0472-20121206/20501_1 /TAXON_ID=693140 ORGANISM="Tiarina fusus, Strain LIS" /NCGR_SAMPLE_ID=MMETSP0472 /ASSEMBLY_ACC=CAM_ASM_000603 /LENGTH=122 /DNA_ID=CAMNT_0004735573 /DNA_START=360 /DNA_END=728 /DNA_ORIENTATION=-